MAKAEKRQERLNAHTIAWRDAFFDLIAGKPHLPSLPPLAPNGVPPGSAEVTQTAAANGMMEEATKAAPGPAAEVLEARPAEAASRAAVETSDRAAAGGDGGTA